jgi:MFS transporter, DHA2 family, multidrug resistance protein
MTAREARPAPGGTDRWAAVVAVGMTVFITAADMTIVGVALPTLSHDFGVGPAAVQWVVLGYVLPLVALGLPTGRWADTVGKRQAFTLAVLGFGAASVLVALSGGLAMMVAARVLQGVFGALISALVLVTIAGSVRGEVMGRAVGLVAALGPLGAAIGPAAGGLLIEAFGWRSVFLVNVPICLLAGWLGLRSIPREDRGLAPPRRSWLLEVVLLAAAGAALLLGLQLLGPPHELPAVGLPLLVLAAAGVVAWARRPDSRAATAILADPVPRYWLLASCAGGVVSGALGFLAPFHVAGGLHASPAVTGLTLLALPAGMVAFAPVGGATGDRWGHHRAALLGTAVLLAGTAALLPSAAGWHPLDVAWRLAVVGAGLGMLAAPSQAAVMTAVPPERGATAGAFSSLMLNLGFAMGPPLGSFLWRLDGGSPAAMSAGYATAAAAALLSLLSVIMVALHRSR